MIIFLKAKIYFKKLLKNHFSIALVNILINNSFPMIFILFGEKYWSQETKWSIIQLLFLYCMIYFPYCVSKAFFHMFRFCDQFTVDGRMEKYYLWPQSIFYSVVIDNLNIMEMLFGIFPISILLLFSLTKTMILCNTRKLLIY